ncbi:MAG: hypothetical protein ACI4VF_05185 [Lachnospirales bacterium]
MKKIFLLIVLAMVSLSGCGNKNTETTDAARESISNTRNSIIGQWKNDNGEVYNFNEGYIFYGSIDVNGEIKEVSGDFNLVTIDGSETTLTINTDLIRVTYYVEVNGDNLTLLDSQTKEMVKELSFAG